MLVLRCCSCCCRIDRCRNRRWKRCNNESLLLLWVLETPPDLVSNVLMVVLLLLELLLLLWVLETTPPTPVFDSLVVKFWIGKFLLGKFLLGKFLIGKFLLPPLKPRWRDLPRRELISLKS